MNKILSGPGWTQRAALAVAAFCVAATATHAQTITTFATGFDGSDTINGTPTATTYASPNFSATYTGTTGPTAPLAGQNGWTTNDGVNGTPSTGNPNNQLNGGTTFVGGIGGFFNAQAGALGGVYAPGTQTPYAVPSTGSGGIISLGRGLNIPAGTTQVVFDVDFAVIAFSGVGKDTFSFNLANTAGTSIFSINFVPTSTTTPTAFDNVSFVGATTSSGNDAISINAAYHLKVTLTRGTTPTYLAVLTGTSSATTNGNLAINPNTISQLTAVWNLTDKTTNANGGLTGAGDNYLAFDNISVTVPEPSTYAMMALGLVGMTGLVRLRRQQA